MQYSFSTNCLEWEWDVEYALILTAYSGIFEASLTSNVGIHWTIEHAIKMDNYSTMTIINSFLLLLSAAFLVNMAANEEGNDFATFNVALTTIPPRFGSVAMQTQYNLS